MAWTTEQIEALREAVAAGITSVSHSGKTVTYASLAEMRDLLAEMERETNPPKPKRRFALVRFSRGD